MMTPLEFYQQQVNRGEISKNPQQMAVLETLTSIQQQIIAKQKKSKSSFSQFISWLKPTPSIKGLYLWGSVGAGKTLLINFFYECLPTTHKKRLHFHQFLQWLHEALKQHQGQKNPLQVIATKFAKNADVICFDEFFVSDIADAMLLAEFFKALFKAGTCLVATSNIHPDGLYPNGLQREQFLPAIQLIKQHTEVMHLHSEQDYRLRFGHNDTAHEVDMQARFDQLAKGAAVSTAPIQILNRKVNIVKQADHVIWFHFQDICGRPRSQKDYLALTKHYRRVLVSGIPPLNDYQIDLVTSLIHLVDVLYDAHVPVIISSTIPLTMIYPEGRLVTPFQRTLSRLIEMQSEQYVFFTSTP